MKLIKNIAIATLFLFQTMLFANYQSTYIPDQVRKDLSEQNFAKYQKETIPTVTLTELKKNAVFNAGSILEKHVTGTPDFNTIVAANVCQVDNSAAYSSTIYSTDLPSGTITCMYAVKDDLKNPQGLFKVFVPEIKAYYQIDTDAAKIAKAADIAGAETQFLPLLQKKQEIISQMNQQASTTYLTIPEMIMAAILTDNEVIDIEATRATGKFQLKPEYTSKFTESNAVVDNTEYILTNAATIFTVYAGLGTVSMSFLFILTVGFGIYGGVRFFGSRVVNKAEKKNSQETTSPYVVGVFMGILLLFPTNQVENPTGTAADFELLKTRYQDFEKFGYYTFADWGKESAKVIIDAEVNALIHNSGLASKQQIASTAAQITQAEKLDTFFTANYSTCLNNIYMPSNLSDSDGKAVFSETDKGLFPSSESWAFASYLVKSLTNDYYKAGDGGLLYGGAAAAGDYPAFAFSACGKASYYSGFWKDRKALLSETYKNLTNVDARAADKINALGEIISFEYQLFRDWGYLSVLGLPIIKMQGAYLGGINKQNEVLEKLNQGIAGDYPAMHSIMSSIPYMFIPGVKSVYDIINDNSVVVGAAYGAAAGAVSSDNGIVAGLMALIGGFDGAVIGATGPGAAALSLAFAYQAALIILEILPALGLAIIGLFRFNIIILKIFSFHFLSLFMLPIMFLQGNLEALGSFTAKILATMLEIPIFVLAVWLAGTTAALLQSTASVFGKNMNLGMLNMSLATNRLNSSVEAVGFNITDFFTTLKIYFYDGFTEVAIAAFSIVITYKIVITMHTMLFEAISLSTASVIDNAVDSMKSEAGGWGTRI